MHLSVIASVRDFDMKISYTVHVSSAECHPCLQHISSFIRLSIPSKRPPRIILKNFRGHFQ